MKKIIFAMAAITIFAGGMGSANAQVAGYGGSKCPAGDQICENKPMGSTEEMYQRIHNLEVLVGRLEKKNAELSGMLNMSETPATGEEQPSVIQRVGTLEYKADQIEQRVSLLEKGWKELQEKVVGAFTATLELLEKIMEKLEM